MTANMWLIIMVCVCVMGIISSHLYERKQKQIALAAKPADNKIHKVFRMEINGNHYYVVKYYQFIYPNRYEWVLYGDFKDYKTMTRTQAIELCDKLNDIHLADLEKRKMTRLMRDGQGTIIH